MTATAPITAPATNPIPFIGTPEEAEAGRATHTWHTLPGGTVCNCGAKTWHAAASYKCPATPATEAELNAAWGV